MTQTRWFCHVCQREWIDPTDIRGVKPRPENTCPAPDCHAIGFVERRTFKGLFDSTTPPEIMASILIGAGEADARARLKGQLDVQEPPAVLMASVA